MRDRDLSRDGDRQIQRDEQPDRQIDRQKVRYTYGERERDTYRERERKTEEREKQSERKRIVTNYVSHTFNTHTLNTLMFARWDFETPEEYSDYMSKREALPKAAFQYGKYKAHLISMPP